MTYTYKLSRRLALVRHHVMLGVLTLSLACSAGEPLGVSESGTLPTDLPVTITPRRVTLEPTQRAIFLAYNRGSTAADSQLTSIEWTASGGTIGADGVFLAPTSSGEYRVVGRKRGQAGKTPPSDSSVVVIVPPQPDLSSINVSPSSASVPSRAQLTFTAQGVLSDGSTVDIGVEWSATGGTIDAGGTYTAGGTPGTYQITAKAVSSGVTASIPVTVTPAATLQSIALSPASISLPAGARQLFTISGTMTDGSKVSITNATFSATGGTIDGSGTYTAGTSAGSFQVTAKVTSADAGTLTATAAISITSTPSGSYPNQPAGFSRIAETRFDGLLPDNSRTCSGYGILQGCWFRYSANLTVTQDASAPESASSVLRYTWPAGLPVGNSAGHFGGWDSGQTEYSQVYESAWFKLEGTSFEAPDAGMKLLGFWGVGRSDYNRVSNEIYVMTPGGTFSQFTLDWCQQGQVSRRMGPNKNGTPLLKVGQWNRYEIVMKLNDVGQANGTLMVWLNGTLTHEYHDVTWRTASAPAGFYGRSWNPIWGGMGNPAYKTKTDYMRVDGIYISAIR